jgi:hypothetical protein
MPRTLATLGLLLLAACSFGDPPQIITFDAEVAGTEPGAPGTLTWSVVGDAVTLALVSGDQTQPEFMNVAVTGRTSYAVSPDVTTSYSLLATNLGGLTRWGSRSRCRLRSHCYEASSQPSC